MSFVKRFPCNEYRTPQSLSNLFTLTSILFVTSPYSSFAQDKTLRIGVLVPLTGDFARLGLGVVNAIKLAQKKLPELNLEFIFEDNKTCTAKDGILGYKKLVGIDKIDALITLCTATANAVFPLAKQKNMPLIHLSGINNREEDYAIEMMPDLFPSLELLAKEYRKKYTRLAFVANSTEVNTGPNGNIPLLTEYFQKLDGRVVFSEEFDEDFFDFRSLITKLKFSGAEAVSPFIWSPKQLAAFLTQADQLRLWDKVDLAGNFVIEVMYNELLPLYQKLEKAKGLMSVNLKNTTSKSFITDFQDEFSSPPPQFADYAYDAVSMLQRCGIKQDCLLHPFSGASGEVKFDTVRRRIGEVVLKELRDGKFEEVNLSHKK